MENVALDLENDFSKIIKLPKDPELLEKLQRKLKEYEQRLKDKEKEVDPYQSPELIFQNSAGTRYKMAILKELMSKGEADKQQLINQLKKEDGKLFDSNRFEGAYKAIRGHCGDKSVRVVGGTGLK